MLVQGDTGPGKFTYRSVRVVAVVDWELAHLGDPMDDIAWLSLRATQEPFTDFPTRLREYEELSGNPIDEARVRYYQVMAEKRSCRSWDIGARVRPGRGEQEEGEGSDVGNGFIYGVLHRRLWLEALAGAATIESSSGRNASGDTAASTNGCTSALLEQLRDVVVPRITDPLAKARSKGFARIIKYLAQVDRTVSSTTHVN